MKEAKKHTSTTPFAKTKIFCLSDQKQIMKDCSILLSLIAFFCSSKVDAGLLDDQAKILTDFKSKYNNSQSDIIFLMDVSGSVSDYGFQSEKIFVENLLNEFSVAPYSTRVAVITFGAEVKTDINYIDISPLSTSHQKCEFHPWFQYNVKHRYGWATNMKDAFQRSIDVLQLAMDHTQRRSGVHTVAILITDGWWNRGSPVDNANRLKSSYTTDVITVGVDGYNQGQLQQLATSNDLVLGFSTFTKFRELAMFIRGGKDCCQSLEFFLFFFSLKYFFKTNPNLKNEEQKLKD